MAKMTGRLDVSLIFHTPSASEIDELCTRWLEMKRELGEGVSPADIKEELVPLMSRLFRLEIVDVKTS